MSAEQGSLEMQQIAQVIAARGKALADPATYHASLLARSYPSPAPIPDGLRALAAIREEPVEGGHVIRLAPRGRHGRRHILYLHGGAYVNGLIAPHWDIVEALIKATGADVWVPIYPLAPEFTHRDAFPFLTRVYRRLLETTPASGIMLAGDSAGGGFALGGTLCFREANLPLPARLVLFSPWLDLTLADPAARALEADDVMLAVDGTRLCGRLWAGEDDPRSPQLSPLYADPAGLPPLSVFQGTRDLLLPDARSFARKAQAAGVAVDYREYAGAFHVFVGATVTPESQDVFRRIGWMMSEDPSRSAAPGPF